MWTLTQTITQVAATSSVKIAMTLKSNSNAARTANLLRYAFVEADGGVLNNFDGTQNAAFAWESIGSGNHPLGLVPQTGAHQVEELHHAYKGL